MIRRVLKNRLVSMGYGASFVDSKIREMPITIDTSQYTEAELVQKIKLYEYDRPSADIPRFYLNVSKKYINQFVIDGKIDSFSKLSFVGSQIKVCDFMLSSKLCIVGISEDLDIDILVYNPSSDICNRYNGTTYEEVYGEEREAEAQAYLKALTANGKLTSLKSKDILYALLSEYVIDIILIDDLNPKLKLYDNAPDFAEILTSYKFKYINRRINRIEFVEQSARVLYKASNIELGYISNDPYLLLNEVNKLPNFDLGRPTYAWIVNQFDAEELAIYTALEKYNKSTYRDMMDAKEDRDMKVEIDKICSKFSTQVGYQVSKQYVTSVVKKLNRELLVPPLDFIRDNTNENFEHIEPLRYKFSVAPNRKEFEGVLYNAIENNLNGRYKYRFVEKLSGIYLTIGNKLNYTDLNGNAVRKQSIADFNINFNAAVIKRETIIEGSAIPQLIGYIYKDVDNIGIDKLPVPSVEVVFYFPELSSLGRDVEMYNGTPIEAAKGDGVSSFSEIGMDELSQSIVTKPKDPNEKYITVKYTDSDGNILKENIIRDIEIGSVYTPEMIPAINDKDGKEWILESNQVPNLRVTDDNSQNIVEVKYIKKMSQIKINYINRQGDELSPPVTQNIQVGLTFEKEKFSKFVDKTGIEWNLYQTSPNKLVVTEKASSNVITLVYDVIKADVFVTYKTRQGIELKPQEKFTAVANKEFKAEVPNELTDKEGLVWSFGNDSRSIIQVSETEMNIIELFYDEKKMQVVVSFVDEGNTKIKDDTVEFVQIGRKYTPRFEKVFADIYGKQWKFSKIDKQEFKVSNNEKDNKCSVVYERVISRIYISMLNKQGGRIKEDVIEEAQVGTQYTPAAIKEIEDLNGLVWTCAERDKSLIVSDSEVSNRISYEYDPLVADVMFRYVDDEGVDLIPPKDIKAQAGSMVTPEFIGSLTSSDQRGWNISNNNEKSFKVSKHKEENIFKINYDKRFVKVTLSFRGMRGDVLKEDVQDEAQIGSEYNPIAYDKITSDNGEKWMLAKTDPETMFVRENSRFILYYDEIKARVIVKCINIADDKSIINDQMIITKLGGVFVPNVATQVWDKNKLRWIYVGEPAMSIVAKENEQENIITLKYEPDMRKVTLKFVNNFSQTVHKDVIKDEQIGSVVTIKQYDKIIEDNGMGWKLIDISHTSITVDENEENNIVTATYSPLMADVYTRFIDNDGNELAPSVMEKVQVGQLFNAKILPTVTDSEGKVWEYSKIAVEPHKMVDDTNKVNIKYIPLLAPVSYCYKTIDNQTIIQDKVLNIQVGTSFEVKSQNRVIDEEGKYWHLINPLPSKILVSEQAQSNILSGTYEKEMVDVQVAFVSDEDKELIARKQYRLQIGSTFNIEKDDIVTDAEGLSWTITHDNNLQVKIQAEADKNLFKVKYDPFMINVYDRFIFGETGDEIIEAEVSKQQVGSIYNSKIKNEIRDKNDQAWTFVLDDSNLVTNKEYYGKLKVTDDEQNNNVFMKYQKKVVEVTIEYLNDLGNSLKAKDVVKLQVGSQFKEAIPNKIVDSFGNSWSFNPKTKADIIVSENPAENIVKLSYLEAQGTVTFKYSTPTGKSIHEDDTNLAQIGSHYTPRFDAIITDEDGCVWEYHERDRENIIVSEKDEDNIVTLSYVPLKVDVLVNYVDLWDNEIAEQKIQKAQLGSNFKLELDKQFIDKDGRVYELKNIKPEEILVKEIPMGAKKNPNEFTAVFEPIHTFVVIKYKDTKGAFIRADDKIEVQVGSNYIPEPPEYIKDDKGNEWQLTDAKKDQFVISENQEENTLIYVYDVAQAHVTIRYVSIDGILIKPEDQIPMQVGQTYDADPEHLIKDKDDRRWHLIDIKPKTLIVGSINNIITVTYQEEKAKITLKYVDENGTMIRTDEKVEAQIGSTYVPKITNKVIYNANEIWRILKVDPESIVVSENNSENLIKLVYSNTGDSSKEEDTNKSSSVFDEANPFADTISEEEKELVSKMLKEKDQKAADNGDEDNFEFDADNLKKLAKIMKLSLEEKKALQELNNLNAEIVAEVKQSREAYLSGQNEYDYSNLESLISKVKDLINDNKERINQNDASGTRFLRIFEYIVSPESFDKVLGKTEQRKAIVMSDFAIDKPLEDSDKAVYICERGKNNMEIKLIEGVLGDKKLKNKEEAVNIKTVLLYERYLLDAFYKARSEEADKYFEDESARESLGESVNGLVEDMLSRQFANACRREPYTLEQQNEAKAIAKIATASIKTKLQKKIDSLDGKAKRNAQQAMK